MKADFAFISDYAAERAGTVGAMGIGIDTLVAAQLPTTHPHIFFVVQFRCPPQERQRHTIALRLLSPDGEALINQSGIVDFSTVPPGQDGVARLVFGMYLIPFSKPGQHYLLVQEGEVELARSPLLVLPVSSSRGTEGNTAKQTAVAESSSAKPRRPSRVASKN